MGVQQENGSVQSDAPATFIEITMEQVQAYTEEQLAAMNWAFEKSGAPTEELFVHVDYSVLGTSASQEVIDTFKGARAIALDNAPAGMPTMFLRGKDLSNGLTFFNIAAVSEDDGTYLPILASIGVQTSDPFFVTSVIIQDDVKYGFVRYDEPQTLTDVQQNQALVNIGSGLMILNVVDSKATLTAEQETALLSSTGVILRGPLPSKNATSVIFHAGDQTGSVVTFYALFSPREVLYCTYRKETKAFTYQGTAYLHDSSAVVFDSAQRLTDSQKLQARTNIGVETPLETAVNTQFQQKLCEQPTFAQALKIPVVGIISDDDVLEAIAAAMSQSATLAAVRYVTQNLTDENKATARENIGVATPGDVASSASFQTTLLADNDFITELKAKLGIV